MTSGITFMNRNAAHVKARWAMESWTVSHRERQTWRQEPVVLHHTMSILRSTSRASRVAMALPQSSGSWCAFRSTCCRLNAYRALASSHYTTARGSKAGASIVSLVSPEVCRHVMPVRLALGAQTAPDISIHRVRDSELRYGCRHV